MRKSILPQLNAGNHTPRNANKTFTRSKEKSVNKQDSRTVRRPHYLPPLLYHDQLLQRPNPLDLSTINSKRMNFDMNADAVNVSSCTVTMFGEEEEVGVHHKMFNRMSKEAQEAYNQTLQEMSSEGEASQRLEDERVANRVSMTTSSISASSACEKGSNSSLDSGLRAVKHMHVGENVEQVSRAIQSEPSSATCRKRNTQCQLIKKTSMPLLRINSRAPISHTAARIGRKKRSTQTDTLSSHSDFSHDHNSGHVRQFEITPLGYDSRYSHNVPCVVHYNTDDDEELATYVLEQATTKCNHWLAYQNGTS